ncbi:cis-prenyltransferase [Trypanosoma theileri]|uniref:Cis-prenyltransferase n=1 Tax=Trypanosoma theileri TaxID=67003 RepID=A0A1X0NGI2_9TRYP|nr:cis-prenyltransferase [Trypanosoma theileri]ORC83884.1 cis-prenyltransferase [Trypanosoma theileri]
MFPDLLLSNEEKFYKNFFDEVDVSFLVFQRCRGRTLDTLTEGFEVLVIFFCALLFFGCLACVSCQYWRRTALRTICWYLKFFEALLDAETEETSRMLCSGGSHIVEKAPAAVESYHVGEVVQHGVRHLAVIMDGNRRYGKRTAVSDAPTEVVKEICENILKEECAMTEKDEMYTRLVSLLRHTVLDGHRVGGEKLMEFVNDCIHLDIQMLTVYAFSTENWGRSSLEIDVLMSLFYFYFERMRNFAKEKHIFIRFISPVFERISPRMRKLMINIEEETRKHTPRRFVLNVCVSYSGRDEVVNACNRLEQRVNKSVPISKEEFMNQMLRSVTQDNHEDEDACIFADCGGTEPQLLLRTSGEQRLSNFMLYECAYTEFLFVNKTWPEITRVDLIRLLRDYSQRDRRCGK